MFKLHTLDVDKITFGEVQSPGVKKTDRKIINLSQIYQPPLVDNPVRKKQKNKEHIQSLVQCFTPGIDYSLMPPVLRWNPRVVDGDHYDYELLCGNHRIEAFKMLGYDRWIFDVYEICLDDMSYEDSVRTLQLQENNHVAQLPSSKDDVINVICRLIDYGSKLVKNTESSISEYVDTYCSNMHHQTKSKVIRGVIAARGAYQDIVTFTALDVDHWIHKNTSYTNTGNLDKHRNKHGWTVLEGYESRYFVNASKKFSETGKESYFICHTKPPTTQEPLDIKRLKMFEKWKSLEEDFIDVINFYNKNKRFPWSIEGFLPQDRKKPEIENELVQVQ